MPARRWPRRPPPPPPQALPAPKILVINRQAILQFSKVGQDIARQVQALPTRPRPTWTAQSKALQAEGQALQQQVAILAPDAKQKKIDAFQAKEAGLQAQAQRREAQIQGGLIAAQTRDGKRAGADPAGMMQQRGANMILDKKRWCSPAAAPSTSPRPRSTSSTQKMSTLK